MSTPFETWFLFGASSLLLIVSLLPLSRVPDWWIRIFDFPRPQFTLLSLALLLPTLYYAGDAFLAQVSAATLLLAIVIQGYFLLRFLGIYRKELPWSDASPDKSISILIANVLMTNNKFSELIALIDKESADVLILLETNDRWDARLKVLHSTYPYKIACPLDNLYGMHLFSRLPLDHQETRTVSEDNVPSMRAVIDHRSGKKIALYAVHPAPPSPTENSRSTERDGELFVVGKEANRETIPTIVAGDFNDVPWSQSIRLFKKLSGLCDPRIGRGLYNTFHAKFWFLKWPLDHLYSTSDFAVREVRRLKSINSDHYPILYTLDLVKKKGKIAGNGLNRELSDDERNEVDSKIHEINS